MNRYSILSGAIVGAFAAAVTWTSSSRADTTVVEPPAQQTVVATPAAAEHDSYTGPNRRLIGTGLLTLGLSYIPAVIVAGTSDQSADHHLYVPIAGPWLDLGDRPGCGAGAGSIGCDTETTYKVLIVADGIFQAIGAVTTVWGFLTPERHDVVTTTALDKPTLHISPAQLGRSGYGLAAVGSF